MSIEDNPRFAFTVARGCHIRSSASMIDLDLKFVIKLTDPGLRLRYRDDEIKAAHLIIKEH